MKWVGHKPCEGKTSCIQNFVSMNYDDRHFWYLGIDGRIILKYNFMKLKAIKWSNLLQHVPLYKYDIKQNWTHMHIAHKVHIYWDICGREEYMHFICINKLLSKLHCIHIIKTEIIFWVKSDNLTFVIHSWHQLMHIWHKKIQSYIALILCAKTYLLFVNITFVPGECVHEMWISLICFCMYWALNFNTNMHMG